MAKSLDNATKTRLKNNYGPWAIVTGATSGIGLELAEQLAASGLHLLLNARNQALLEQTSSHLQSKYGIQVRIVAADLSLLEGVEAVISAARDLEIGLLVPNAGFGTSGLFEKSNLTEEVNMLRLNCEAVLRLVHHFIPFFQKRKRSGILLMSSLVAFQGVPYAGHYAATKAYVQSLAEALAVELKPHHIDVLAAAPGPVKSGFSSRANMKMSLYDTPAEVASPILRALGRSSAVVPGGIGKLLVYSLRTVPRWTKVRIMKIVMGGMTAQ